MSTKAIETWTWVLIYGGLLLLCLGLFVMRQDPVFGWALVGGGVVAAAIGVVLIPVRARLTPPPPARPPTTRHRKE